MTLAEAGCWADDIRADRSYDWAKPLHYVNVPRDAKAVDQHRDCQEDKCVLGAIDQYIAVLRDRKAPKE